MSEEIFIEKQLSSAFLAVNCANCNRKLANTRYSGKNNKTICPICALGAEGNQSKYWETSETSKPEGFRYPDDTAIYTTKWDVNKKIWLVEGETK